MFLFRFVNKPSGIFLKTLKLPSGHSELRHASRWTHRKPVRVLTQEEFEGETLEQNETPETNFEKDQERINIQWRHATQEASSNENDKLPKRARHLKQPVEKQSTFDMLQTVIDAEGNFVYTKMANNDRRIAAVLTIVKSKKQKEEHNLILLEGKRLIKEALDSGCKLQHLLFTRKEDLEFIKSSLPKNGANLYKMPYREMQMWSDLVTSPGIMGIFVQPDENFVTVRDALPVIVICDNVRDPGNLGSILRICAGAGCRKLILTKGCVNVWDTKVTRSGSGAHFHLPIQTKVDWPQIQEMLDENCKIYLADSAKLDDSQIRNSNNDIIPLIPYYSTEFQKDKSVILIVGGETHGLSDEAHKFAEDLNGVRLNIPLVNNIESLNSGVALGVIIFEIKKQLLMQNKET